MSDYALRLQDWALELVVWYEGRPDRTTHYRDERIAEELGWFRDGKGDAQRVRAVRRYVDKAKDGLYGDYHFGTKTNGRGVKTSRLLKRGDETTADPLSMQVGEQIARSQQAWAQHGSEVERMVSTFVEAKDAYVSMGDFERAFCADHLLRDVEQFGHPQLATVDEARKLGIPIPRGAL